MPARCDSRSAAGADGPDVLVLQRDFCRRATLFRVQTSTCAGGRPDSAFVVRGQSALCGHVAERPFPAIRASRSASTLPQRRTGTASARPRRWSALLLHQSYAPSTYEVRTRHVTLSFDSACSTEAHVISRYMHSRCSDSRGRCDSRSRYSFRSEVQCARRDSCERPARSMAWQSALAALNFRDPPCAAISRAAQCPGFVPR